MPTARAIIRNALTFGLNRLSPGEQEDADLFGRCLDALGSIVDEMNGGKGWLWRELLTASSPITGTVGTLGTTWPGLASGDLVLSATVLITGTDQPMDSLTLEQYQAIPIKTIIAPPQQYAQDGAASVYIYPAATGHIITLRTKQAAQNFEDLDTAYSMPAGFQSAFEALLAEKIADTLVGAVSPKVARDAARARRSLSARGITPAIINSGATGGRLASFLAGR